MLQNLSLNKLKCNIENTKTLHLLDLVFYCLIQVRDRYHACVASDDLSPPEGEECEKRVVKHLDKSNSLPAR